jgi:cell division protein FtsL
MVRRKFDKRTLVLITSAGLLMIGILTFYLWHITEDIRYGYAISRQEAVRQQLANDIRVLLAKKAALLSPDIVEKKAREDLKLIPPRDDQVLYKDY